MKILKKIQTILPQSRNGWFFFFLKMLKQPVQVAAISLNEIKIFIADILPKVNVSFECGGPFNG